MNFLLTLVRMLQIYTSKSQTLQNQGHCWFAIDNNQRRIFKGWALLHEVVGQADDRGLSSLPSKIVKFLIKIIIVWGLFWLCQLTETKESRDERKPISSCKLRTSKPLLLGKYASPNMLILYMFSVITCKNTGSWKVSMLQLQRMVSISYRVSVQIKILES